MRPVSLLLVLALPLAWPADLAGQNRAIRRTIPISRGFAAALAAGTRDSTGRPGPRYWQLHTDYRIEARLDVPGARLSGHETISLRNPSDSAWTELYLRLYQNHFAANVPRDRSVPGLTDGITISRLTVNGQAVDLAPVAARWRQTTIARVPLATPIPAGSAVMVEADWSFVVPEVPDSEGGERMGRWGTRLFQLAQWYPQLAMYDDMTGWDRQPYLGAGEFYNNFGSFDVRLDLPGGWLVGATGVLANPDEVLSPMVRGRLAGVTASDSQVVVVGPAERGAGSATAAGDRLTWHFTADSVADFAWATSDEFVWDATRATIPGRGPIPVHLLYLPEHERFRQTGAFARHALEFYSALWMPYAFPAFTQVDGPENGMEYPMLTMSGPGFGVTDHEIGHQWWPMMVGNNETAYGWMDEGFNQYMNILSRADSRGLPPSLDSLGLAYGRVAGFDDLGPMMWNANYAGRFYSFVTYGKAPEVLSMLGGIVGDSAVQRAMGVYARTWRFRHPSPWDFMFLMDRELGRNLDWFWYYALFTTDSVDGAIADVATRGGRTLVTVRQDGEMPSPVVLRVEFAPGGPRPRPMKNAVFDSSGATVTWPVDVWFGGQRSFVAALDFGRARITRITLDPHGRFPDRTPDDHVWPRPAQP
jgi:hypothetical protein